MRLTAKTSPILGTNPKTRTLHIMLQFCRTARQMLANSQHILIVHTKKEANCVAHRLSRLAFTTSERYWMEDVSSQLSFDVQHDLGTIFVPERQYPTVIEELCHKFSLADLRKSTNNFHHKRRIERGGFGIVYKDSAMTKMRRLLCTSTCPMDLFINFYKVGYCHGRKD
ncbi:hypothetical protein AAZX31_18G253200 [Glycine max]